MIARGKAVPPLACCERSELSGLFNGTDFLYRTRKHANRLPRQAYIRLKVDVMSSSVCDVTLKCIG